jgi:hypothetical protein
MSAAEKAEKPSEKSEDKTEKPAPRQRYPLRVDVAKPAVIYTASFNKDTKPSPSRSASGEASASGASPHPRRERVLGKRRRGGGTEFLVKRPGCESTWEAAKSVAPSAVQEFEDKRQSKQLLQSRLASAKHNKQTAGAGGSGDPNADRTPHRILAQKRFEGGQRFLVHWVGCSVTDASWESAKRLNNPSMIQEFEMAVRDRPTATVACFARPRDLPPPLVPSAVTPTIPTDVKEKKRRRGSHHLDADRPVAHTYMRLRCSSSSPHPHAPMRPLHAHAYTHPRLPPSPLPRICLASRR